MSYHRNNMIKKRVAKKFHCQFGHSSAEKTNKLLKSPSIWGQELNRIIDTVERVCNMPKIQKTKTETSSRIFFIQGFSCYSS